MQFGLKFCLLKPSPQLSIQLADTICHLHRSRYSSRAVTRGTWILFQLKWWIPRDIAAHTIWVELFLFFFFFSVRQPQPNLHHVPEVWTSGGQGRGWGGFAAERIYIWPPTWAEARPLSPSLTITERFIIIQKFVSFVPFEHRPQGCSISSEPLSLNTSLTLSLSFFLSFNTNLYRSLITCLCHTLTFNLIQHPLKRSLHCTNPSQRIDEYLPKGLVLDVWRVL